MYGFKVDKGKRRDVNAASIRSPLYFVTYREGRLVRTLGPFVGGRGRRCEGHARAVEAAATVREWGFVPRIFWRFSLPPVYAGRRPVY